MTRLLPASEVDQAALILQSGGLVAFPTETVYGLGADARDGRAVAAIYQAKGRPSFNPLIVHVATLEHAMELADFNDTAWQLAKAFWPGPLSLVVPVKATSGLSSLVTAGLDTVAIRVPAHPLAQDLLALFDGPVAAPSANPSGSISPTTAQHVLDGLDGRIEAVLDGGACAVGLESTIVLPNDPPALLRAGGISLEALQDCLGGPIGQPDDPETPLSPGQLLSHYAPKVAVRLNAEDAQDWEVLLGFGGRGDLDLSPSGDLQEAAANLFAYLRLLDTEAQKTGTSIAVSPIPDTGLGLAINDRLKRAAAPR